MHKNIKNIIIHSPSWVGDTIMSIPSIRAIRNKFPQAHITLIIKKNMASLFQASGFIDDTIYQPQNGKGKLKAEMELRKKIKNKGYDLAVIFPNSFGSALRLFGCGIKERIGYGNESRGFLLTKTAKRTPEILSKHMSEYYLNILTLIDIQSTDTTMSIKLTQEAEKYADDFLKANRQRPEGKLFAFGIGSANNQKKLWNPKYYKKLAIKLTEEYDAEIVLICSPSEQSIAEEISKGLYHKPIISKTNIINNCAVINRCDGFVGNDSGAMHMSAALGVPTIGLFFATSSKCNYPLGENAHYIEKHLSSDYIEKKLVKKEEDFLSRLISPDDVLKKMKKLGLVKQKNSDI